jgi:tetratricopeptide (TPR) repeat protein
MPAVWLRVAGLALSAAYATFIVWLYAAQPRTFAEVRGGMAASVGAYSIDKASFDAGLAFFRRDQFEEARTAFARADPAERDPTTQFYIAYSYMRQGWGRLYHDDALYRQAQAALAKAVAASPSGSVRVDDPGLALRTSDELKAELERGLRREASDLNPLKLWKERP